MNISSFAVRRWQFTLVLFGMLLALGVSSLFAIPKSEDPTFPFPAFVVVAVLPGGSPLDVERLVVDPIEDELAGLDDVKKLESDIRDGLAIVRLEFDAGVDVARKEDEVRREIESLRASLPAELVRLEIVPLNPANVNIMEVGLVSDSAPYAELDRLAHDLSDELEAVPGAWDVTFAGLPTQEVRIEIDFPRMRAIGLSPLDLMNAVGAESRSIPAGSLDAGPRRFTVRTSGDYPSVDAIRDTFVRAANGRVARVRDVAEVTLGEGEAVHVTRLDGRRAVLLAVNQRPGQNLFQVRAGLDGVLRSFESRLPSDIALVRAFDQSENVSHRLTGFARDFGIAILLVLITLLPLGLRASVIVMISIPLSLALGLAMLHFAGYGINQLSIVGFVIALGLLVDDSIVVVENIARFLRLGHSPRDAAIAASKQIMVSVLGCTATLILAFVPLLALPGAPGQFIRSLPLAVVLTVAASLLVSLTIVPFLSSLLLREEGEHGNRVFQLMSRVIEASYRPVLRAGLAHPFVTLLIAAAMFVGAIALAPVVGFSLFPKANAPQFLVRVELSEGASLEDTDRAAHFVETVLAEHDEVRHVATNVGKGNPQIYYNIIPQNERPNFAELFVSLDHFDPESTPALYDTLRSRFETYPGARIRLVEFENGPPVDAPIAIRLLGDDVDALAEAGATVEELLTNTPGTRDVRNPTRDRRTDLRLEVDPVRAEALGVAPPDVDRVMRLALGGIEVGRFRAANDDEGRPIRAVLARDGARSLGGAANPSLTTLDGVFVGTSGGGAVPLGAIADLVLTPSPTTIRHYGGTRSATITAFTETGRNTDRVTTDVLARLATVTLPTGVRWQAAGEVESRRDSFGGFGNAILIALFGVLAVLVLEFRTFKGTLIVASVIPLGVVGGMGALYLTGNTLSFTAMVGFIALMGIEVKNSILLVDFTNQLREEGLSLDAAIQKAGEIRFVPILLTTATAIGGLVPLALERSPLYSPLAWVMLGGLVSSTLLARIVTPVMYKLLPPNLDKEESDTAIAEPAASAH